MKESIQQIKTKLMQCTDLADSYVQMIRLDERKGVQQALLGLEKRIAKDQALKEKYQEMLLFENQGYANGHQFIAGIDEVGRGPLAGPVVAAAVILPKNYELLGLNDSKQLSEKKREELYEKITENALAVGIGVIEESIIDQVNIYEASKLAMIQAVEQLTIQPTYLLIDAMVLDLPIQQEKIIKGDARSVSIAAASVIAKVYRDRMMKEYEALYPGYGFAKNAGYGTQEHLNGLKENGITPIHRKTFAPVKQYI
ncbi:ribonuclease HII [Enterococcus faecalis 13-SD-W-01]|nr:ribonuclease HII [Enterococcus faecalis 13-SD-W-01]